MVKGRRSGGYGTDTWRPRDDARCGPVQDRIGLSAGPQGGRQNLLTTPIPGGRGRIGPNPHFSRLREKCAQRADVRRG